MPKKLILIRDGLPLDMLASALICVSDRVECKRWLWTEVPTLLCSAAREKRSGRAAATQLDPLGLGTVEGFSWRLVAVCCPLPRLLTYRA